MALQHRFDCVVCGDGVEYPSEEALSAHRAHIHFKGQHCDLVLASPSRYMTHLKDEHGACEVCLEVFPTTEDHRAPMADRWPCKYGCPNCSISSETFSNIIWHIEMSSSCGGNHAVLTLVNNTEQNGNFYKPSPDGLNFYCKGCGNRWAKLSDLAEHLEETWHYEWLLPTDREYASMCYKLAIRYEDLQSQYPEHST